MGISANDFWQKAGSGKAMVRFLTQRGDGDVECVRDVCDWLISKHKNDLVNGAKARGANEEQANAYANDKVAGMYAEANGMTERTMWPVAEKIIDFIFFPYFKKGLSQYLPAMKWFADQLRERIKSVSGDVDFTGQQPDKSWLLCKCHPSVQKKHQSGQCLTCGGLWVQPR